MTSSCPSSPVLTHKNLSLSLTEKKRKSMALPVEVIPPRDSKLPVHKHTLLREIFEREKLALCQTLAEQYYCFYEKLILDSPAEKEWMITFTDVGHFFRIDQQQTRKLSKTWGNLLSGVKPKMRGRPPEIEPSQINKIIEYVQKCDEDQVPLTQTTLKDWINTTFSKAISFTWIHSFVQSEK